jgi:hypothetical protein
LDIYFCPKRKNQTTFGKWYFVFLYILFTFILKETYTIPFYTGHFFQLVRSPGSRRAIIPRTKRNCLPYLCRHYRGKPDMSGVTRYRSRFYSTLFCYLRKKIYTNVYIFLCFIFFMFYVFYFLCFTFYIFYLFIFLSFYKSSSSSSSSSNSL